MSEDVEMDAPKISTLNEEEPTEPPSRATVPNPKLRVKLLLGDAKRSTPSTSKTSNADPSEDEDEDEDEEDQLIDDDEDEKPAPVVPPPVAPSARSSTASTKRGGPRTRGGAGGKRRNAKADSTHKTTTPLVEGWTPDSPGGSTAAGSISIPKKRSAPKGGAAPRTAKKRAPKVAKAIPPNLRDDAGNISEAYAGTAASSPLPHDEHTPEPESASVSVPVHVHAPVDEMTLEGVPLPVYPLPSKPFPVQPPPKIGSGFAPIIPLDKSGRIVRKWRQANREIRGIAGGRWFAKTWIGDKESEFATAVASAAAAAHAAAAQAAVESAAAALSGMSGMTLPNLKLNMAGLSGTASGKATPRLKALKTDAGLATGPSSRAASTGPESISAQIGSRKRSGVPPASGAETPVVSTPAP